MIYEVCDKLIAMNQLQDQDKKTFTDFLRRIFKRILDAIAGFLNRLGVKPMIVTIFGLIGNLGAGILIATGSMLWGGITAMLIWPLDALDGSIARLRNESSQYGAFVDAVTDRYSEIAIFGGLLVYFVKVGTLTDILLVFIAAVGSIMVSYLRAKAESLDFSAKIGLLSRAERYIVLMPGLIFGYPRVSLWILAVFSHFTVLQRFLHVRRQVKVSKNKLD